MPPKQPPEWFVATADLYVWHPGSGTMPSLSYRAGERVPAEDVGRHPDWAAKVRPERLARPDRAPAQPSSPSPARPRAGKS
jgi:hypothetical protein